MRHSTAAQPVGHHRARRLFARAAVVLGGAIAGTAAVWALSGAASAAEQPDDVSGKVTDTLARVSEQVTDPIVEPIDTAGRELGHDLDTGLRRAGDKLAGGLREHVAQPLKPITDRMTEPLKPITEPIDDPIVPPIELPLPGDQPGGAQPGGDPQDVPPVDFPTPVEPRPSQVSGHDDQQPTHPVAEQRQQPQQAAGATRARPVAQHPAVHAGIAQHGVGAAKQDPAEQTVPELPFGGVPGGTSSGSHDASSSGSHPPPAGAHLGLPLLADPGQAGVPCGHTDRPNVNLADQPGTTPD